MKRSVLLASFGSIQPKSSKFFTVAPNFVRKFSVSNLVISSAPLFPSVAFFHEAIAENFAHPII